MVLNLHLLAVNLRQIACTKQSLCVLSGCSTYKTRHFERLYSSGVGTKLLQRMGFKGKLKYNKNVLYRASLRLYLCSAELVDAKQIINEVNLPDTFNSWFRIVGLHAWLTALRLAQEGQEGRYMRNNMVKFMWEDVEKKSKKLGESASYDSRNKAIQVMGEQFTASLFAYDEGIVGDDRVLAGALWRNLFDRNCSDIQHLELMVGYVRKQAQHLDTLDEPTVLVGGLVPFLPLFDTPDAKERHRLILAEIGKRV